MGPVVNGQERSNVIPSTALSLLTCVHQLVDSSRAACLTTRQCVHRAVQKVLLINLIKSAVQARIPEQRSAAWTQREHFH